MTDPVIATIWFTDGVARPVYEGSSGHQYVIDDDGEKVYGVWFVPPDALVEPDVVIDRSCR